MRPGNEIYLFKTSILLEGLLISCYIGWIARLILSCQGL